MDYTNVRISIKACRVNAGLEQREFAEKVGVTVPTVISWEMGKTEPKLTQLRIISELSKIPMEFISVVTNRV